MGLVLHHKHYEISDNATFKNSRPLIVNKPTLYIIAGNVLQSKAKKARTKRPSSQMPQFCPTNFILTSKFASPSLTSGYVTGTKTKLQQPAFNPFGHTMVNRPQIKDVVCFLQPPMLNAVNVAATRSTTFTTDKAEEMDREPKLHGMDDGLLTSSAGEIDKIAEISDIGNKYDEPLFRDKGLFSSRSEENVSFQEDSEIGNRMGEPLLQSTGIVDEHDENANMIEAPTTKKSVDSSEPFVEKVASSSQSMGTKGVEEMGRGQEIEGSFDSTTQLDDTTTDAVSKGKRKRRSNVITSDSEECDNVISANKMDKQDDKDGKVSNQRQTRSSSITVEEPSTSKKTKVNMRAKKDSTARATSSKKKIQDDGKAQGDNSKSDRSEKRSRSTALPKKDAKNEEIPKVSSPEADGNGLNSNIEGIGAKTVDEKPQKRKSSKSGKESDEKMSQASKNKKRKTENACPAKDSSVDKDNLIIPDSEAKGPECEVSKKTKPTVKYSYLPDLQDQYDEEVEQLVELLNSWVFLNKSSVTLKVIIFH